MYATYFRKTIVGTNAIFLIQRNKDVFIVRSIFDILDELMMILVIPMFYVYQNKNKYYILFSTIYLHSYIVFINSKEFFSQIDQK